MPTTIQPMRIRRASTCRAAEDDDRCQQVQSCLADIGNGALDVGAPEADDEPGDRYAPAAGSEGNEESIDRDSAARLPVRMGTRRVRWSGPFCGTDEGTPVDVEGGDHARRGNLVEQSSTGDREDLSQSVRPPP